VILTYLQLVSFWETYARLPTFATCKKIAIENSSVDNPMSRSITARLDGKHFRYLIQ